MDEKKRKFGDMPVEIDSRRERSVQYTSFNFQSHQQIKKTKISYVNELCFHFLASIGL